MTTTSKHEVERRGRKAKPKHIKTTFAEDFAELLAVMVNVMSAVRFPTERWRDNPVAFFREVLGVEPWSKQVEIINSIRDNKRVAVKSGHKVSKSHTAAGIALWFYCSFVDARVVMTSTTSRQVDTILWREARMMRARAGRCVACKAEDPEGFRITVPCPHSAWITGSMGELARTGIKSVDFREVVGFTAKEAEAVAGVSGKNLLYILDEASGIKPEIYEAIEGNRAGGARVVMFSNPTKTSGEFYEAFTEKKKFYALHTISSRETPNVVYGDDDPRAIPGLATREWIEEKDEEWGKDSPLTKVRVDGEFAELEDAKIFSVHRIAESEDLWGDTPALGRLWIGVDPAGETGANDESAWAWRRGYKHLGLLTMRGLSAQAILVHTLGLVNEHRKADTHEVPVVCLDIEGELGHKVYNVFAAFLHKQRKKPFELVSIRASDGAHRNPIVYDRMRDELCANLSEWMNDGGAILEDTKLEKELNQLQWVEQERTGKVKLIAKKELRKILKRSPDRYDALALCCWEPDNITDEDVPREEVNSQAGSVASNAGLNPYNSPDGMDPYGGL